jgi:mono/diheme cytochrome c family protein
MIERLIGLLVLGACVAPFASQAHDITTRVTWNREISRIFYARCASCHRPGGEAFPLLTYEQANAWTAAIKDSVLSRRMPPWGAVKGFGEFKNDGALTQEEITLIALWVTGGAPEGNPDNLATQPTIPPRPALAEPHDRIDVSGDYRFGAPLVIAGFTVAAPPTRDSAQITIRFPDGHIEPLVWLYHFQPRQEPFLLRAPRVIPAGAELRGLSGATLTLLAPKSAQNR